MPAPTRVGLTMLPWLAVLLVSARAVAGPVSDPGCVGMDNAGECARAIESRTANTKIASHFKRYGPWLVVLAAHNTFLFRDGDNPDGEVQYSYIAYLPKLGLHVIRRQYGEGHGFTLIPHTGRRAQPVPGYPFVSPGATRILSHSQAGEAGYNEDSVEVWLQRGAVLRRELHAQPDFKGCAVTHVQWLSETAVQFTGEVDRGATVNAFCRFVLRRLHGSWVFSLR